MVTKKPKTTKKKNPGGRPTKFLAKYEEDTFYNGFISECRVNSEPEVIFPGDDESAKPIIKKRLMLPSIERFAEYIGVDDETLLEWAKIHKKFSATLNKLRAEQKKWVMENGLTGEYNPVIAKLILSSNHGMSDKVDQKTTIEDKNGVLRSLFNAAQGDGEQG